MITFDGRLYEPCHITRPKTGIIDKYYLLTYFLKKSLHSLIQFPLNMILQLPLSHAILRWPNFYHSLFKYIEGRRYFCTIVTKPLSVDYRRPVRHSNQITFFNVRYFFHSLYQVKGAYARLHQKIDKDLEDAVAAATSKVLYDDPLNLAIP